MLIKRMGRYLLLFLFIIGSSAYGKGESKVEDTDRSLPLQKDVIPVFHRNIVVEESEQEVTLEAQATELSQRFGIVPREGWDLEDILQPRQAKEVASELTGKMDAHKTAEPDLDHHIIVMGGDPQKLATDKRELTKWTEEKSKAPLMKPDLKVLPLDLVEGEKNVLEKIDSEKSLAGLIDARLEGTGQGREQGAGGAQAGTTEAKAETAVPVSQFLQSANVTVNKQKSPDPGTLPDVGPPVAPPPPPPPSDSGQPPPDESESTTDAEDDESDDNVEEEISEPEPEEDITLADDIENTAEVSPSR